MVYHTKFQILAFVKGNCARWGVQSGVFGPELKHGIITDVQVCAVQKGTKGRENSPSPEEGPVIESMDDMARERAQQTDDNDVSLFAYQCRAQTAHWVQNSSDVKKGG